MLKVERWVCELCFTEYDTEEKAKACECSHEVVRDMVHSIYSKDEPYPPYVIVRFKNNVAIKYRKDKLVF